MRVLQVRSFLPRTICEGRVVDAADGGGEETRALGGRDSAICASARNLLAENGRKSLGPLDSRAHVSSADRSVTRRVIVVNITSSLEARATAVLAEGSEGITTLDMVLPC